MSGRDGTSHVGIREVATVVRSKNAGPFRLTFDILFTDREVFERVAASGVVTPARIAGLYGIPEDRILQFIWFDAAKALKITIVRPHSSAAMRDTDVYGAQQHAPLLSLTFPRSLIERRPTDADSRESSRSPDTATKGVT